VGGGAKIFIIFLGPLFVTAAVTRNAELITILWQFTFL
jgi:hypothetical protein